MTVDLAEVLEFAIEVAKAAGTEIVKGSEARLASSAGADEKKNTADLVTETDQSTERLVRKLIAEKYPDHKFIGEESYAAGDIEPVTGAPTWIIDPIDGTTNFVKGFQFVCISIGFTVDAEPAVGVIYAPFMGYLYTARKGNGSYLTTPLHPEPRKLPLAPPTTLPSLRGALLALEWGSDRSKDVVEKKSRSFARLMGDPESVEGGLMALGARSLGSSALNFSHVAMGCLDAYWEIGCWAWDVCAGIVIAREAGCIVVGSSAEARSALMLPNFEEHVPSTVLTGRKYLVVRKIGDSAEESGRDAQIRTIRQMYDAIEEWDV
ncbi:inositol-phosphate phosphatase [Malassezia cuniculi]|uniref:Inositol-1-monophosphatase n=1 Tax=Malassezia cuniculi TaxID=948313 RepID=A0AAF0ETX4_9BASI|nr:inositol-phosphate phosphatase [Malassezia cuniculi]